MKTILSSACAALLLLGIAGCANTVNTVEPANQRGSPNVIEDRRVETDRSLSKDLDVIEVVEGTASGDLQWIQVSLRNNKRSPINISYAFEWFDLNGMQVSQSGPGWRSLRMLGKEERMISAVAPNPQAVDFRLKLAEPSR